MTLETLYEVAIASATAGVTDLRLYTPRYDLSLVSVNSATTQTIVLPDASTAYDKDLTFVKLGSGKVIISAGSTDWIANSATGGSIYNEEASETYATLTLKAIPSASKWLIVGAHGTWRI